MSKHTDHTYEDYILDGRSMARTLALSFGLVALAMIVIGTVRDSTVLVVMALLYFGVGVPLILGWQQLLPWLRRRTREHWKRPSKQLLAMIDHHATAHAPSTAWQDLANTLAREMLEDHGPLGARYATYTLAAFRDAHEAWVADVTHRHDAARAVAATMRIALLPLHPRWSQAILDGTKTVELRRRPLRPDTTHIAIYETAPTQRIVAIASIKHQEHLGAWKHRTMVLLAGGHAALAYIDGAPAPVALWLDEVSTCNVRLAEIGVSRAPQSVQYLDTHHAALLLFDVDALLETDEQVAA